MHWTVFVQANFKPEPIRTEADEENDITSLRRNTQGWLYLAAKTHVDDAPWRLPRVPVSAGGDETMRQAAYRAVQSVLGESVESYVMGHMPAGHLTGAEGEQTFLMLGIVLDGQPELQGSSDMGAFAWLTRGELLEAYQGDEAAVAALSLLLVE